MKRCSFSLGQEFKAFDSAQDTTSSMPPCLFLLDATQKKEINTT